MRIIIAGSRDFNDYHLLFTKCNQIFAQLSKEGLLTGSINQDIKNMEIISGTARGADELGEIFAEEHNISVIKFPADWDTYGKSAGYRRNAEMALYAKEDNGILIAFWDGISKGTNHMIDLAKKYGLKVFVVNYKEIGG
jgi:hypothetical protein